MRERIFLFLLILGFGILIIRLFVLQVVQGNYYRDLAEGNRIKIEKIPALRGVVYDRNAKVLVRNTPGGREYLEGQALAHVLGYLGQVSAEELKDPYSAGDLVGKMGIEKQYDLVLRGTDGGILEEVDAHGNKIRQLSQRQPIPGKNLNLTLDLDLQKKAFEAMKGKKGAVIAQDPKNGAVLALVSTPSFNQNFFTLQSMESTISGKINLDREINKIINDSDQPMFDRAISGVYPPGSTFKIVTALAGLEEGKITAKTQIEDKGQIEAGGRTFGNWYFKQYGKTEGSVDIIKAIQRSNDIFFYRAGEALGIEKMASWARKFWLGSLTGIDLPDEEKGLVPDKKWRKETKGENWYLGDDFITAIGQGDLLVTPLQVNVVTAAIANEGLLCRPRLVDNKELKADQPCEDLGIKDEYLGLVKEGMERVCETGGTAWPFFDFGIGGPSTSSADFKRIEVACKTGTAEAPGEKTKSHAWFTAFAPAQDPEIVLTVLVEKGGEGSSVAGPIARDILKWWFEKKNE